MNKSESKYFNTARKMNIALISLIKEKQFEYITIRELCKEAEVNRSTFYLHYENMYDLLQETIRRLLDDFYSYFINEEKAEALDFSSCRLSDLNFICDKYLVPFLTYMKENREIISATLSYKKTFGFDSVYEKMFEKIFNPVLDRFHYPTEDRKFVMMYYLNGINAVVLEWIKEDCKKPISEISKIIVGCVFGYDNKLLTQLYETSKE